MKHIDTSAATTGHSLSAITPEWVLAEKYASDTGVTRNAIHQRRKEGVWLDGLHCGVVARRLYVNVKKADEWIKSQLPKPPQAS